MTSKRHIESPRRSMSDRLADLIGADGRKYGTDTAWNLLSLAVQLAAGAALTIGFYFGFGSKPLGVFNQLYAIFAVSGQFFVLGLNDSVLKHSAQHHAERSIGDVISQSGLLLALGGGILGGATLLAFASASDGSLLSPDVQLGLYYLSPALLLFVINKVVLGLLNGEQRFFRFALAQALRAVALVALAYGVLLTDLPLGTFGACFALTEAVVLLSQIDIVLNSWRAFRRSAGTAADLAPWIRRHLSFGLMAMPHGFLSETFIRVDILVLMLFVDDAAIGIYSFAAFFVEGLYQLPVLVRNITNPRLVHVFVKKSRSAFLRLLATSGGVSFLLTAAAGGLFLAIVPFLENVVRIPDFDLFYGLLLVLIPGLVFYSFSIPFDYAPLQAGRPALQSLFMVMTTGINVIGNLVLIPHYGLTGAAMATALAMVGASICLWIILLNAFRISSWPEGGT